MMKEKEKGKFEENRNNYFKDNFIEKKILQFNIIKFNNLQ